MKKIIIFLLVIFAVSASRVNSEDDRKAMVLAGIGISEYRKIAESGEALDRLYCSGDECFFLISRARLRSLIHDGIRIRSVRKISDERYSALSTFGDINGDYHNYNETLAEMEKLTGEFPGFASLITIGQSVEGRGIHVLKISDNVENNEDEPNIFIIGCHHAREWISVEVPLLYARYLLESMNSDERAGKAVNGAQIYILPVLNPDGLEFSILKYRYWRKNRRYNGDLSWGVDLNRNYSYMWGLDNTGSSPHGLSEIYRGSFPFSEPETEALRAFMTAFPPSGVLSYHNYSQVIMYPWGYTNDLPEDFEELDRIGRRMSDLIYEVSGRQYVTGSGSFTLYNTNGDLIDWVYATFRAPAYTIELPPEYMFEGGFFTSMEEIRKAFEENLPALLYFSGYFIENVFPQKE